MEENLIAFENALSKATDCQRSRKGIGMQSEKTLHLFLKNYLCPDESFHEIKLGKYVADLYRDGKIVEIQTRSFNAMRKKLEFFLDGGYDVTIVHPLSAVKTICKVNPETGETESTRKSPKKMTVQDAFKELYKIKMFLDHPRLHLKFILLELTEYRTTGVKNRYGKPSSRLSDRIPTKIVGEACIDGVKDYLTVLPDGLPHEFTSRDYSRCAKITLRNAGLALNVLKQLGVITAVGKQKNSILYSVGTH